MKILLSAYACEPDRGSEPGVGWQWAVKLAKLGHDIWVITRSNNRGVIEKAGYPNNLHFIYYDLPGWACWWKKGSRGVRLYYLLWQWGAYLAVKDTHKIQKFDLVHHITFGVYRQPSFMWMLRIYFIFGPVGGGELVPMGLKSTLSFKHRLIECLRESANKVALFDPLVRLTLNKSDMLLVKTPETLSALPSKYQAKAKVQIEIGVDIESVNKLDIVCNEIEGLRLLFVGRLLYWKGVHLALDAFREHLKSSPESMLTFVGSGPEEDALKRKVKELRLESRVQFIPWVAQVELKNIYTSHDVLLFPSMHDSSGNVILEAFSRGLPVVCLNTGGPGVLVCSGGGVAIDVKGKNFGVISKELASTLTEKFMNHDNLCEMRKAAFNRAKFMTWTKTISEVYENVDINK